MLFAIHLPALVALACSMLILHTGDNARDLNG